MSEWRTSRELVQPGEPAWSWIDLALAGPPLFIMGSLLLMGFVHLVAWSLP